MRLLYMKLRYFRLDLIFMLGGKCLFTRGLKIIMGFGNRMIINLRNDIKFTETGQSKEKLLAVMFSLPANPDFFSLRRIFYSVEMSLWQVKFYFRYHRFQNFLEVQLKGEWLMYIFPIPQPINKEIKIHYLLSNFSSFFLF